MYHQARRRNPDGHASPRRLLDLAVLAKILVVAVQNLLPGKVRQALCDVGAFRQRGFPIEPHLVAQVHLWVLPALHPGRPGRLWTLRGRVLDPVGCLLGSHPDPRVAYNNPCCYTLRPVDAFRKRGVPIEPHFVAQVHLWVLPALLPGRPGRRRGWGKGPLGVGQL